MRIVLLPLTLIVLITISPASQAGETSLFGNSNIPVDTMTGFWKRNSDSLDLLWKDGRGYRDLPEIDSNPHSTIPSNSYFPDKLFPKIDNNRLQYYLEEHDPSSTPDTIHYFQQFFGDELPRQFELIGGTGVSNGGGGDFRVAISFPDDYPLTVIDREYPFDFREFADKNKVILEACAQNLTERFPPFPEDLQGKVVIKDQYGHRLRMDNVCEHREIFLAYVQTIGNLWFLKDKSWFQKLLDLTLRLDPSPVEIRLFADFKKIIVNNGYAKEFMWFNNVQGFIGVSKRRKFDKPFQDILSRPTPAHLIHEFGHAFTFRLFGGYPDLSIWHDYKQGAKYREAKSFFSVRAAGNAYLLQSSELAALTETFSNVVELPLLFGGEAHPFIADFNSNPCRLVHSKERNETTSCRDERFVLPNESLVRNEAYLSTLLQRMSRRYNVVVKPEFARYRHTDHNIIEDLIEAFYLAFVDTDRVGNSFLFFQWMQHYDELQISTDSPRKDEAWRLLREFFFFDYKTGKSTYDDFRHFTGDISPYKSVVLKEGIDPDSFISPYLDKLGDESQFLAFKPEALEYTPDSLVSAIQKLKQRYQIKVSDTEQQLPELNVRARALREKVSAKVDSWKLASEVYRFIENGLPISGVILPFRPGYVPALAPILAVIEAIKADRDIKIDDLAADTLREIKKCDALLARVHQDLSRSPHSDEHIELYIEYYFLLNREKKPAKVNDYLDYHLSLKALEEMDLSEN